MLRHCHLELTLFGSSTGHLTIVVVGHGAEQAQFGDYYARDLQLAAVVGGAAPAEVAAGLHDPRAGGIALQGG
jgi:hypothetical protein